MNKVLADRLKELRLEKKLSFAKLSQETGISTASLCRWEKMHCDVPSDDLVLLAKYYKVSTDYLLGLED